MDRLDLKKEPHWIELSDDVRFFVKPISIAIMSAAYAEILQHYHESDITPDEALIKCDLIKEIARNAIIKWENVVVPATWQPAEVNDENINAITNVWHLAQDFWDEYISTIVDLEAEGKIIRAMCKWHFSGGIKYCNGCRAQKLKCKKKCPYVKYSPQTQEGHELWDIILRYNIFDKTLYGDTRIDTTKLLDIAKALGYDEAGVLSLAFYAELGVQDAVSRKETSEYQEF